MKSEKFGLFIIYGFITLYGVWVLINMCIKNIFVDKGEKTKLLEFEL